MKRILYFIFKRISEIVNSKQENKKLLEIKRKEISHDLAKRDRVKN